LAAESPRSRLRRALDDGNIDEARHWLVVWEAREPPSYALLCELALAWEELGDLARASEVQRRAIGSVPAGDFAALTRFVATCKLAELQRRDGAFQQGWQTLQDAAQIHGAAPEWMAETARRDLAWQAIRLAGAVPVGDALGPRALAWACEQMARGCPLSTALLEDGCAAAARQGDQRAAVWLGALLAREPRRALVDGAEMTASE
jgi:hypothetical protein